MSQAESAVIVGGGMAGANAAFTLRKLGYQGRVAIVSAETELPYERPPLSKDYLRGESTLENAYVRPAPDYDAENIELLAGRTATAIDVADHRLQLDDGSSLTYSALVLATGSEPRTVDLPAVDPSAVHTSAQPPTQTASGRPRGWPSRQLSSGVVGSAPRSPPRCVKWGST